jgi:LacI family transcriptional regulator, repressor for deo operon, udp, cdd, tsx, nupC, and nupG
VSTPPGTRTRLTDLAEAAGVSTATVSRVINGKPGVAEPTRQAVLQAQDMLGYERPERLRGRSVGLVGLVVPELTNPVFPLFAQRISAALTTSGFTPLLCTQVAGGTTEDEYTEILREHGVDGIVFVSGLHADRQASTDRYHQLRRDGVPLVMVNGYVEGLDASFISADDGEAMDLAVRHLASLGHTSIGLVVGPHRFTPVVRKIEGFAAALVQHLGVADADPYLATSLFTLEGGQAAATQLIERGCTGIVCASDVMALGAVRAARARGLRVPDDVSVVGYDDSPLIALTDPPLTTVRQRVEEMSAAAVNALVTEMSGSTGPRGELVYSPELIVRASTARAPS